MGYVKNRLMNLLGVYLVQRKIKFTDVTVKNLQPDEGQVQTVYTDLTTPGLRMKVSATAKSWTFDYVVTGSKGRRTRTLGRYPALTLKDARDMARETYTAAQNGVDLKEQLKAKAEAEVKAEAARKTLRDVIDLYEKQRLVHRRTGVEVGRCLRRELKEWLNNPIEDLTEDQLASCLTHATVSRQRVVRAYIRAFTKWARQRKHIAVDPGAELLVPEGVVLPRERVLSIDEVRALWEAAGDVLERDYRDVVRLLILTAQRRSIISELTWSEVVGGTLDIAGSRTKNATSSVTHLSAPARAILDARERGQGRVFSVPSLNHMKAKLDKATGIGGWRYHDLRHTFATNMAERGIPAEVVDLVLHHKAGSTMSMVARVYNRSELLPQRAQALDAWAELING